MEKQKCRSLAGGCNTAIGGQGQLGCMRPVCHRSVSKLRISVPTMLKDAATLSWLALVKQVQPSRDSFWLASANGGVVSLSPGEGRTALQTIVLPRSSSSMQQLQQQKMQQHWSSKCSLQQKGAAWQHTAAAAIAAEQQQQQRAAEQLKKGAACSSSSYNSSGQKGIYCRAT